MCSGQCIQLRVWASTPLTGTQGLTLETQCKRCIELFRREDSFAVRQDTQSGKCPILTLDPYGFEVHPVHFGSGFRKFDPDCREYKRISGEIFQEADPSAHPFVCQGNDQRGIG